MKIWLFAAALGFSVYGAAAPCPSSTFRGADWNGWSIDSGNSRFQPVPGLSADQVPNLKLKWVFGYPGASIAFSQPTIAGGRLFVGSQSGTVYSLDPETGCVHWTFDAGAGVRSAIRIEALASGKKAALFADLRANAYAVDAESGALLWKVKLEDHPDARITGSPASAGDRLYVPVSSTEEGAAQDPKYSCCTFRGSVAALDISSGRILWKAYSVPDVPKPYRVNRNGTELRGPAGAAIWSAPTIDQKRNLLYVATGNSYTGVEISTSDAIIAFDLDTGGLVWSSQLQPGDNFVVGCPFHPNCPDSRGPDFDFGSSPILRPLPGGKQILVAAQKSGVVYGLDPDQRGTVVWRTRIGEGGGLGGVEFGPAADDRLVYAAVSDRLLGPGGKAGLYALDLATGALKWATPAPAAPGNPGQSAAVTAIPGIVFSGALNGHLRAYAASTGQIVWDFDTNRSFDTVNGVAAKGGSVDGPGPVISGGMVFMNSGYGSNGGIPGNVLLAFSASGR